MLLIEFYIAPNAHQYKTLLATLECQFVDFQQQLTFLAFFLEIEFQLLFATPTTTVAHSHNAIVAAGTLTVVDGMYS